MAVAIVSSLFLATRSTKESTFNWLKSHSPFSDNNSQITKKGTKIEQLKSSKILKILADGRSSRSCQKFKPSAPVESAMTLPQVSQNFIYRRGLWGRMVAF